MREALPATALLLLAAAAQGQTPAPPREELQGLAAAFEQAVGQTTRPSFLFPGFDAPRSFYLPGVGAVIVLSPRSLPVERRALAQRRVDQPYAAALRELEARLRQARSPEEQQALSASVANLRRLQALHAEDAMERARGEALREAQRVAASSGPVVLDLRELERQVLAMQEEAERARREAEERLEQLSHEVRLRLPSPPEAPRPPEPPQPAAAPAAPRMPAPWAFWFEFAEEGPEPATPSVEVAVGAVRAALKRALESQGPRLSGLGPQEAIVVAVDLVSGEWFGRASRRRTLVARVGRKDLEARAAGKLDPAEFARRVELTEY